jgi:hypothetical protein
MSHTGPPVPHSPSSTVTHHPYAACIWWVSLIPTASFLHGRRWGSYHRLCPTHRTWQHPTWRPRAYCIRRLRPTVRHWCFSPYKGQNSMSIPVSEFAHFATQAALSHSIRTSAMVYITTVVLFYEGAKMLQRTYGLFPFTNATCRPPL